MPFIKGHKINVGKPCSKETREKLKKAMTGKSHSPEAKRKISMSRLGKYSGENCPMYGKHHSPTAKAKMREAKIGMVLSEETKRKMSEAQKGSKHSNGRLGKRHSDETKKKIGSAHKGMVFSDEARRKMSIARTGIARSIETRTKISMATKGKNNPMFGRSGEMAPMFGKHPSPETVKKMLSRRTPTSLEKKFLGIVEKNGLPYKFVGDGSFMIGRKNPDFININGKKIAVEVYARYYKLRHAETVQAWRDERERVFKEYGWTAIFFDETQVTEENVVRRLEAA